MSKLQRLHGILPPHLIETIATISPERGLRLFGIMPKNAQLVLSATFRKTPYLRFADNGSSLIEVYDAQNRTSRPGKKARFEGDAPVKDDVVNKAYSFSEAIREFYKAVHNRNGIDAHGMKMVSTVHYDRDYDNAFWDGSQMTYGDGDGDIFASFVILDVAGHEVTHGVTEFAAGTEYYGQSGALNEHFSDVWGESIEAWVNKTPVAKMDWVIGNGIFMPGIKGTGIRNMLNPGTAYNDPKLGKDPQPAHMKDYYKTSGDNGGVHYNSGIPNRAFALFARELGGNVWDKACGIWYAARVPAGAKPSFAQFAFHTIEAAKALGTADDVAKLKKAWSDVGVAPNKLEGDLITPSLGEAEDSDSAA